MHRVTAQEGKRCEYTSRDSVRFILDGAGLTIGSGKTHLPATSLQGLTTKLGLNVISLSPVEGS